MISCSSNFLTALKSPIKQLHIKLEFYNSNMEFIEDFTKELTEDDLGTISVDITRPIRRSFSIGLSNIDGKFLFSENNLVWIDKRIKLYLGLKLSNGDIEYIPQGVFILSNPSNSHTSSDKKCYIDAVDKAFLLTDKRGKFVNQLTIVKGTNVATAIKLIAQEAGETLFNFDDVDVVTPYEITYEPQNNRWDAIQELAKLAIADIYFDVYGYLRLKKIDLNEFEQYPAIWSFKNSIDDIFYDGTIRKLSDEELANHIIALGGSSDTATVRYELIVDETNELWKDSSYSIQKIGDILYFHNDGNPDSLLSTELDCKNRCKYELRKRLGFTEQVELYSASPIYLFECGDIIEIEDLENGITNSKYLIQSFNLPIKPDIMTIECSRYQRVISDWNFI